MKGDTAERVFTKENVAVQIFNSCMRLGFQSALLFWESVRIYSDKMLLGELKIERLYCKCWIIHGEFKIREHIQSI